MNKYRIQYKTPELSKARVEVFAESWRDAAKTVVEGTFTAIEIYADGEWRQLSVSLRQFQDASELNAVELFAGSRSFGKVANELGIRTFSADWQPFDGVDYVGDIADLRSEDVPAVPNILWASPDCTTYSIAAISTHRNGVEPKTDYARKCDAVNRHWLGLLEQWRKQNPKLLFYFENPRGMLGKMPFMQGFEKHTVWYCQYGDERAKPTHIFTNDKLWTPRPQCHNGNKNCHHTPAPRGAKTGTQGRKGSFERSRIPEPLIREILASAISQLR